jgi:di/tricarboxylate transporter
VEAIVMPASIMEGRTASSLNLRWRHGVNLLAVARQGSRVRERLDHVQFAAGDVVLWQGDTDRLKEAMTTLGCLPLAERDLRLGRPRRALAATGIFAAALVSAATGLLPVQIAVVTAATAMVLTRLMSLREAYDSIDWPVIVLLGAMLPVGGAVASTGGTALVAQAILDASSGLSPFWVLALLLVSTMMLSDVINNNATAVLMAPIALTLATRLDVNPDAFLMAVALGASCAFLTPIGHQSNTLVLAPGGYKFGDYWRVGLPLEIVITAVALPLLLRVWPL